MARCLYRNLLLFSFCSITVAYAGAPKTGQSPEADLGADSLQKKQATGLARREVLREAVKSQESVAALPVRQRTAEEKALLRQQLRQQRLEDSR